MFGFPEEGTTVVVSFAYGLPHKPFITQILPFGDPQVLKLSRKIDQSQVPEIQIMQQWLRRNDQFAPDTASWHSMRMDGMLSDEEIAALGAAKGTAFDRLFLVGMIKHHEGAIKMVDELFKSPGAGQEVDTNVFANDVVTAQQAEIGIMRSLLAKLPAK